MAFFRPFQRSICNLFNLQGLNFLTQSRLGLSHLNEHRFRHNLKDCINPLCSFSLEVENTLHFFLHYHHYSTFRMGPMNRVNQIDKKFSYSSDDNKVSLLLYGDSRFHDKKNNFILSASIIYILETKIFDFPLPKSCLNFHFSLTLIDTFHFKLFWLVILFTIVFTFSFLVTKYQLGDCWMYFILDFHSLCRSFCRKK